MNSKSDFLKQLLAGGTNIYDYAQSPDQNDLKDAALDPVNQLPTIPQRRYLDPMPTLAPNSPLMDRKMLDFSNEPDTIVADAPDAPTAKPSLPFQYKNKPLPEDVIPKEALPTIEQQPSTPKITLEQMLAQASAPKRDDELANAQSNRNSLLQNLLFIKAGNTIAQGSLGNKVNDNYLSDNMTLAGKPVEDILARHKEQRDAREEENKNKKAIIEEHKAVLDNVSDEAKADPDSELSKGVRDFVRSMGMDVSDSVSYSQLDKLVPNITSKYQTEENRASRKEVHQMMMQQRQDGLDEKNKKQLDTVLDKDFKGLAKDFDTQLASSRSGMGQLQKQLNTSKALQKLMDGGDMTSQEMRELATGQNALIGGSNAVSQIEHMDYPSFQRSIAEQMSRATGKMVTIDSPEYKQRIQGLIDREDGRIRDQMKANMDFSLKKYPKLIKSEDRKPDVDALIDAKMNEMKAGGKKEDNTDEKVSRFMKDNNITDKDEAIKILKDHGKL